MDISIVSPVYNEHKSIEELVQRCQIALNGMPETSGEIILVDDGSTDGSWEVIERICTKTPNVKGLRFRINQGKSQALNAGFAQAEGSVIITMDSDLQDPPEEIPLLYHALIEGAYDVVSGWKKVRHDSLIKVQTSKLFNYITRKFSGIPLNDFNCGFKAYRKEVVKSLYLYNDMHRYIPLMAKSLGYQRIGQVVTTHHKRPYGHSKFGYERFFYGFLDLISLWFIGKFSKRPMHFFGSLGLLLFMGGILTAMCLGGLKLYLLHNDISAERITKNAWFYISLSTITLGASLFLTGFLGEMINANSRNTPPSRRQNAASLLCDTKNC